VISVPTRLFQRNVSGRSGVGRRSQRGLTLVELMIVAVLLTFVGGTITAVMFSFTRKVSQENARMNMREQLRNTVRGLEKEVRNSSAALATCPVSRCGTAFTAGPDTLILTQPVFINNYPKTLDPTNLADNDVVVLRVVNNNLLLNRYPTAGSTLPALANQVKYRGVGSNNVVRGRLGSTYKIFSYFRRDGVEITTPATGAADASLVEIQLCGSKTGTYGQQTGGNMIECKMVDTRFLWRSYASPTPSPTPACTAVPNSLWNGALNMCCIPNGGACQANGGATNHCTTCCSGLSQTSGPYPRLCVAPSASPTPTAPAPTPTAPTPTATATAPVCPPSAGPSQATVFANGGCKIPQGVICKAGASSTDYCDLCRDGDTDNANPPAGAKKCKKSW
jgi:type II secretory pathway pseudopilin PulG